MDTQNIDDSIAKSKAENWFRDIIASVQNGKHEVWNALMDDPKFQTTVAEIAAMDVQIAKSKAQIAEMNALTAQLQQARARCETAEAMSARHLGIAPHLLKISPNE